MPLAPLLPSGIGPVDVAWGGLERPGAYLLVGAAAQGRLDLSTRVVGAGTSDEGPTLLFSAREPVAILALGRQAGVDLAAAGDRVHLKGVPLGAQLTSLGENGLARMLEALAESAAGTARVVVEDFTPFVRFRSFETFGQAFQTLVDAVASHGATLVLGLGEPANDGSRRLLDFVEGAVSGTIRLADGGRMLHLIPGTAHAGLGTETPWDHAATGMAPASPGTSPPTPSTALPSASLEASGAVTLPSPPRGDSEQAPIIHTAAESASDDSYPDHDADGYGGTDADALDAGALVVSAVPSEPFGYPPTMPASGGDGSTPLPSTTLGAGTAGGSTPLPSTALGAGTAGGSTTLASDGEQWASIQAVDAPPTNGGRVEPVTGGFLIDSDSLGITLPEPTSSPEPRAAVYDVPNAPALDSMMPEHSEAPQSRGAGESLMSAPDFGSEDPEAGFTIDLDEAFQSGGEFLVVALRMTPDSPHFERFPTVADGFLGALTGADRALVRDDEAKLVALLPVAAPDAPQRLMGAVRDHLAVHLGPRADSVFRSVAVLVLPQGKPFTDPRALLDYVLA